MGQYKGRQPLGRSEIKKPRGHRKPTTRGKMKYYKYLKSKDWQEIREMVLERDGHKCMVCGRTNDEANLVIHHRTYEHIYNEKEHLEDLITLCGICHRAIHECESNMHRFSRTRPLITNNN